MELERETMGREKMLQAYEAKLNQIDPSIDFPSLESRLNLFELQLRRQNVIRDPKTSRFAKRIGLYFVFCFSRLFFFFQIFSNFFIIIILLKLFIPTLLINPSLYIYINISTYVT